VGQDGANLPSLLSQDALGALVIATKNSCEIILLVEIQILAFSESIVHHG
jgi:hypothetical protein